MFGGNVKASASFRVSKETAETLQTQRGTQRRLKGCGASSNAFGVLLSLRLFYLAIAFVFRRW